MNILLTASNNVQTYFAQVRPARRLTATLMLALLTAFFTTPTSAGVALGATRVVYPAGQKQVQLPVTNNDEKSTYLIQSWIEDESGKKDAKFVLTPPLFTMQGKKENTLRIIDATGGQLPQDRESLFWINVKAIPAMDKSRLKDNTLQLAIISRIKLYYRPSGLDITPDAAPEKLEFRRGGGQLTLTNPTPYYLAVTEISAGNRDLGHVLVPPKGEAHVSLPADAGREISWRTINDYGALSPVLKRKLD